VKIRKIEKATTTLVLPDMHFPWANWKAIRKAHTWAEKHDPDVVVQLGDIVDAKAWSRWPKEPDDPSPAEEFDLTCRDMQKLHSYFPDLYILNGNHDRRYQAKAFESSIPSIMIRGLDEMFDFPDWEWIMDPDEFLVMPSDRGPILFMHGDETGGTPLAKASKLGYNVVQGHTHRTSIRYIQALNKFYFGAEMGHLMDTNSKAAKYAARNPVGMCCGFGVIKHGVPWWIPADKADV
jgi:predicted phosphodiesterase